MRSRSLPHILFGISLALIISAVLVPTPRINRNESFPAVRLPDVTPWVKPEPASIAPQDLADALRRAAPARSAEWQLSQWPPAADTAQPEKVIPLALTAPMPLVYPPRFIVPVGEVIRHSLPLFPHHPFSDAPDVDLTTRDYDRIFRKSRRAPVAGVVVEKSDAKIRIKTLNGPIMTIPTSDIIKWEHKRDLDTAVNDALANADTPASAAIAARSILKKSTNYDIQKRAFKRLNELLLTQENSGIAPDTGALNTLAFLPRTPESVVADDPDVMEWSSRAVDRLLNASPGDVDCLLLKGDIFALGGDWAKAADYYMKKPVSPRASDPDIITRRILAHAMTSDIDTALAKFKSASGLSSASWRNIARALAAAAILNGQPDRALTILRGKPLPERIPAPPGSTATMEDTIAALCGKRPEEMKNAAGLFDADALLSATALLMSGRYPESAFLTFKAYTADLSSAAHLLAGVSLLAKDDAAAAERRFAAAAHSQTISHAAYASLFRADALLIQYRKSLSTAKAPVIAGISGGPDPAVEKRKQDIIAAIQQAADAIGLPLAAPAPNSLPPNADRRVLALLEDIGKRLPFRSDVADIIAILDNYSAAYAGPSRDLLLADPSFDPAANPVRVPLDDARHQHSTFATLIRALPPYAGKPDAIAAMEPTFATGSFPVTAPGGHLLNADINAVRALAYINAASEKFDSAFDLLSRALLSHSDDTWSANTINALHDGKRIDGIAAMCRFVTDPVTGKIIPSNSDFKFKLPKTGASYLSGRGYVVSDTTTRFRDPDITLTYGKPFSGQDFVGFSASIFVYGDNEAEIGIRFQDIQPPGAKPAGASQPVSYFGLIAFSYELPDDPSRPLLRTTDRRLDVASALKQAKSESVKAAQAAQAIFDSAPPVNIPDDLVANARTAAQNAYAAIAVAKKVITRATCLGTTQSIASAITDLQTQIQQTEDIAKKVETLGGAIIDRGDEFTTEDTPDNATGNDSPDADNSPPATPRYEYAGVSGRNVQLTLMLGDADGVPALLGYVNGVLAFTEPVTDPDTFLDARGRAALYITAQAGQTVHVRLQSAAIVLKGTGR